MSHAHLVGFAAASLSPAHLRRLRRSFSLSQLILSASLHLPFSPAYLISSATPFFEPRSSHWVHLYLPFNPSCCRLCRTHVIDSTVLFSTCHQFGLLHHTFMFHVAGFATPSLVFCSHQLHSHFFRFHLLGAFFQAFFHGYAAYSHLGWDMASPHGLHLFEMFQLHCLFLKACSH